jgi:hypothetical protein
MEKRASQRVPFKNQMRFNVMGSATRFPDKIAIDCESLNVSDTGIKIREEGRSLREGYVLVIRFPITETKTTVPVMAQVQWVKPEKPGIYEAGLMFIV